MALSDRNQSLTRRLRRDDLTIEKFLHKVGQDHASFVTPDGVRVALFYTKVLDRLLTPLLAADRPPAPLPLRRALHVIDESVDSYIDHALIRRAA